jgi:hypothetical protein
MESKSSDIQAARPRRSIRQVLLSYFYWTSPRGSVQYDIMVTAILLFIFVTPHLWNYGDKPSTLAGPTHPIQVTGDGGRGIVITLQAADVNVPTGASDQAVKKLLRKAIEPVTGDAVAVERWETVTDAQGNSAWKVWAHR